MTLCLQMIIPVCETSACGYNHCDRRADDMKFTLFIFSGVLHSSERILSFKT